MNTRRILKEEFRTSSHYTLQEWNALRAKEKELIAGLHDEGDVYGVFLPTSTGNSFSIKVAYREPALVYLHLAHSALLPRYLRVSIDEELNNAIAKLVLDQVLEIKWEDRFVSGGQAIEMLFGKAFYKDDQVPRHIARLSRQAIEYVLRLDEKHVGSIATRLYAYHTTPWDASLRKNFTDSTDALEYAFSAGRTEIGSLITKNWSLQSDPARDHWLGWTRRNFSGNFFNRTDKPIYKLYISPVIGDLPAVVNLTLPIITSSEAFSFKIGNGIRGLLRPDKMVVYFEKQSALMQAAAALNSPIIGCKAQGVPFTAQVDENGILSWGVDPPGLEVLETVEGGSWRCKVTDQIALAVLQSRSENLGHDESLDFIGSKLFLSGINPGDWTPVY